MVHIQLFASAILADSLMIQKESWVYISDNTNVKWIKTFHLYQGFQRKKTKLGNFIKGSARIVEPPRVEYKGFKYKYSLKGDILKSIIIRTKYKYKYKSSSQISLNDNASIIVKKNLLPQSKFMKGPTIRGSKRKKLTALFDVII